MKEKTQSLCLHYQKIQSDEQPTKQNQGDGKRYNVVIHGGSLVTPATKKRRSPPPILHQTEPALPMDTFRSMVTGHSSFVLIQWTHTRFRKRKNKVSAQSQWRLWPYLKKSLRQQAFSCSWLHISIENGLITARALLLVFMKREEGIAPIQVYPRSYTACAGIEPRHRLVPQTRFFPRAASWEIY